MDSRGVAPTQDERDWDGERTVDMGPPLLLTKQQAAAWAQVSVDKIQEWMHEPGFPAIKTPRHVRIHTQLFQAWLAERAKAGTA